MPLIAIIGGGALLVCGTAFALFLGIASSIIEREREREIAAQEHEAPEAGIPRHAA